MPSTCCLTDRIQLRPRNR